MGKAMVEGVIDGQLILSTRLSPGHIFLLSFCAQTISFLSFFVANFAFLTYTTAFTIQIFDGYGFVYKLYTTYRVAQGNTTPVQSASILCTSSRLRSFRACAAAQAALRR